MWISKEKWSALNKKIVDLESKIQGQQKIICDHMETHQRETDDLKKALNDTKDGLNEYFSLIRTEIIKQVLQELNH